MLKPLFINPKDFIGTKSSKIKIDKMESKIELVKEFYIKNHQNTKESNLVISNFLQELFYQNNYAITEKNGFSDQKGELDLAIKDLSKENSKNEIIIELKKPNDNDMMDINNFYKKSFYQAIYYYLSDKKENNGNSDINFLIITDNIKWFFIKIKDLEDALFGKVNSQQKDIFFQLNNENTQESYDKIEDYLKHITEKNTKDTHLFDNSKDVELPFTFFHLKDIVSTNNNEKLELFIKSLSDGFLFNKVDMIEKNSLNQIFYQELLYIIGLKEVKAQNKSTLEPLDNKFSFVSLIKQHLEEKGIKLSEKDFKEKSLELSLLWINRIIFIKLFSSVLQNYKIINKSILNNLLEDKKTIFVSTNYLFFNVLNIPKDKRTFKEFGNIPYINSSLFEKEEIESSLVEIKDLFYNANVTLFHEVKENNIKYLSHVDTKYNNKLNILEYLIHFLNTYDIAVDERFSDNSDKDLINASVLGMIFEKLNGYKDGSFYTPSYITEYMANKTIEKVIIAKFNAASFESTDIDKLRKEIYINDKQEIAKEIFHATKICDPAVGSGHFLVSSLNSMLFYKSKLGLFDNITANQLEIIDDAIYINNISEYSVDATGDNSKIQLIYEEIYSSKKEIIKNSLFGVDLNPKSVKISRLRLWIELLKHTHLTKNSNYKELELLPNIDINVKQGNSLISKYTIDHEFNRNKFNKLFFDEYKNVVAKYKDCRDKEEKKELKEKIDEIKRNFLPENSTNVFEWRYEFSEILDENGIFLGFDLIIGNPPYMLEDDNKEAFDGLHHSPYYQGKTDIWHIFTGKSIELLKPSSFISFIAKNQWMKSSSASKMRKAIYTNTAIENIIDFGSNMIFKGVGQQTMIFILKKDLLNLVHDIDYIKFNRTLEEKDIEDAIKNPSKYDHIDFGIKTIEKEFDEKDNLTFASFDEEKILFKISSKKNFEFDEKNEIIQGIIGGKDKYFTIEENELHNFNENEIKHIHMFHTNTGKYCTQNSKQYIIYLSKKGFKNINLEENYPNFYKKLHLNRNNLEKRREVIKKSINWFNLWWARDEDFFKKGSKLVWAKRTEGKKFTYTEDCFYGSANLFFIKTSRIDLKYISAILNSKLMYFYMKKKLKNTGELLQIDKNQFLKIPLYKIKDTAEISKIVDEIIKEKKEGRDTLSLEDNLDILIYKIYDITYDERQIIEKELED